MADTVTGYITVYESSDEGSGDPAKTVWQFFVGNRPVITGNHFLAQTVRLAIHTHSQVRVTFDSTDSNRLSQVRIAYQDPCKPDLPQLEPPR